MKPIVSIQNVTKVFDKDFKALDGINLEINQGEIFALLGPNGAGKTTLISAICGLNNLTSGIIKVDGHDNVTEYKKARNVIGLVPQELSIDSFETVLATVKFSRGLFGKPKNPKLIERILKDLSLWDKKDNKLMTLSGGMKRRVMIAKALAHEPQILFLDEPTAGVDVALRKDMWRLVRKLQESGVTIILTTHYIEEAEEMADRIGVISKGKLIIVDEKDALMNKLGKRQLVLDIAGYDISHSDSLKKYDPLIKDHQLIITYGPDIKMKDLIDDISKSGVKYSHLFTKDSSLEEIFVELVQ